MAQALLSDERFRSQSQELLVRVLEAYTGALLAQDQIELARAQKRSYREQFHNQRQFERGNGTRTDTLETQARFNLAQAQEIEARDRDAALRGWSGWSGRRWRSPTWRRSANASRCAR